MKTIDKTMIQKTARALRALGSEFSDDADCLEAYAQSADEGRFVIANAGTTNTGKSTLFNALLGHDEAFKTADVRETTVCRDIGWDNGTVFTDTPGCGSCAAADDREAAKAYRRADLVLFVHNLSTGGLQRDEMNVLESVRRYMGDADFRERTIIIGTRLDSCPGDTATVNRKECEDQIKEELGVVLKFIAVSPKRHFRGLKLAAEGNGAKAQGFIAAGGVENLANVLMTERDRLGKRGIGRFRKTLEKVRRLIASATADLERRNDELRRVERAAESELAPLRAEVRRLESAE